MKYKSNKFNIQARFFLLRRSFLKLPFHNVGMEGFYNIDIIKKTSINTHNINRQKEIVEVLDKFNVLTNDIAKSLPKEIKSRRKQYELMEINLLVGRLVCELKIKTKEVGDF